MDPTYDYYSMHFPIEILTMIIKELPVEDHLNLKLASKCISAIANQVMDVSVHSREEQVTCSDCSRLLDHSEYIEAQLDTKRYGGRERLFNMRAEIRSP